MPKPKADEELQVDPKADEEPRSTGPLFVRFTATVQGPWIPGGRVSAGSVARNPLPELLDLPHEVISPEQFKAREMRRDQSLEVCA